MTNQERDELLTVLSNLIDAVNNDIARKARGHNDGGEQLGIALDEAEEKLEGWNESLGR